MLRLMERVLIRNSSRCYYNALYCRPQDCSFPDVVDLDDDGCDDDGGGGGDVTPTFEVKVITDLEYIVLDSQNVRPSVVVQAMYTFGKGVSGSCELFAVHGTQRRILRKEVNIMPQ
ncbi:hypothetical protein PoB_001892200 [Plakobranchus ocellatus]|uniref:Macroglobulin domain-containing protein n=1 Tax=Plakobranchus ocellatus TaxID=259542 RepID=A0AAV3ZAY7_9GAST|nr:hypothetical protein PoB_001892200 [Plakobranchus ocellatus]